MVLYGRNAVHEAIRGPRTVHRILATAGIAAEDWIQEAPAPLDVVTREQIESRCGSVDHQGVCAEVSEFLYADLERLLAAPGLIVALDQVQDPQNLGAICRTAECAAAAGLVIPERRAATVTAAVSKASAGAVEHLAIARVRNLADFLAQAKRSGRWCYGADAGAQTPYDGVDYGRAPVLVFGSEGRGLRPRVAAACDLLVAVPVRGRVDSLNVSAAAAVLIYEASKPRTAP